jgi:hypothetical protein
MHSEWINNIYIYIYIERERERERERESRHKAIYNGSSYTPGVVQSHY